MINTYFERKLRISSSCRKIERTLIINCIYMQDTVKHYSDAKMRLLCMICKSFAFVRPYVEEMPGTHTDITSRAVQFPNESIRLSHISTIAKAIWRMSRNLHFHQLSFTLYPCLVVPKENNCTLQKYPILLTIIPEIEVNLKICGPEKPTCMTTMSTLHNESMCHQHVHSCSRSTEIHSTEFRT